VGQKAAILVDAQFSRTDADAVIKMIRSSGKSLSSIFITHGHPDHYFGLEAITAAFPQARVLARPSVVSEIRKTSEERLKYWKPLYKDEMPNRIIIPKAHRSNLLMLEDQRIDVIDLKKMESRSASVLYIPSMRVLISGDLVYNQVHLWLADKRGSSSGWIKSLKQIESVGPIDIVLPGHGEETDAKILKENIAYLEIFQNILNEAPTKEDAIARLKEKFPKYRLPVIAELSMGAKFGGRRKARR